MSKTGNVKELLEYTCKKLEEQMNAYDITGAVAFQHVAVAKYMRKKATKIVSTKENNLAHVRKSIADSKKKQLRKPSSKPKPKKRNLGILEAFGLESLTYKVPLDAFTQNEVDDYDHIVQTAVEKAEEDSNKYFISQLERRIGNLSSFNSFLVEHEKSINKTLKKLENEYKAKSEDANQDLLNISSLQTCIHELQSEIHQANEQQEQKKQIISKFQECSQIKDKIDKCKEEDKLLMKELERYRPLPPDLDEAQAKLDQLKRKFRQISDELTNIIQRRG